MAGTPPNGNPRTPRFRSSITGQTPSAANSTPRNLPQHLQYIATPKKTPLSLLRRPVISRQVSQVQHVEGENPDKLAGWFESIKRRAKSALRLDQALEADIERDLEYQKRQRLLEEEADRNIESEAFTNLGRIIDNFRASDHGTVQSHNLRDSHLEVPESVDTPSRRLEVEAHPENTLETEIGDFHNKDEDDDIYIEEEEEPALMNMEEYPDLEVYPEEDVDMSDYGEETSEIDERLEEEEEEVEQEAEEEGELEEEEEEEEEEADVEEYGQDQDEEEEYEEDNDHTDHPLNQHGTYMSNYYRRQEYPLISEDQNLASNLKGIPPIPASRFQPDPIQSLATPTYDVANGDQRSPAEHTDGGSDEGSDSDIEIVELSSSDKEDGRLFNRPQHHHDQLLSTAAFSDPQGSASDSYYETQESDSGPRIEVHGYEDSDDNVYSSENYDESDEEREDPGGAGHEIGREDIRETQENEAISHDEKEEGEEGEGEEEDDDDDLESDSSVWHDNVVRHLHDLAEFDPDLISIAHQALDQVPTTSDVRSEHKTPEPVEFRNPHDLHDTPISQSTVPPRSPSYTPISPSFEPTHLQDSTRTNSNVYVEDEAMNDVENLPTAPVSGTAEEQETNVIEIDLFSEESEKEEAGPLESVQVHESLPSEPIIEQTSTHEIPTIGQNVHTGPPASDIPLPESPSYGSNEESPPEEQHSDEMKLREKETLDHISQLPFQGFSVQYAFGQSVGLESELLESVDHHSPALESPELQTQQSNSGLNNNDKAEDALPSHQQQSVLLHSTDLFTGLTIDHSEWIVHPKFSDSPGAYLSEPSQLDVDESSTEIQYVRSKETESTDSKGANYLNTEDKILDPKSQANDLKPEESEIDSQPESGIETEINGEDVPLVETKVEPESEEHTINTVTAEAEMPYLPAAQLNTSDLILPTNEPEISSNDLKSEEGAEDQDIEMEMEEPESIYKPRISETEAKDFPEIEFEKDEFPSEQKTNVINNEGSILSHTEQNIAIPSLFEEDVEPTAKEVEEISAEDMKMEHIKEAESPKKVEAEEVQEVEMESVDETETNSAEGVEVEPVEKTEMKPEENVVVEPVEDSEVGHVEKTIAEPVEEKVAVEPLEESGVGHVEENEAEPVEETVHDKLPAQPRPLKRGKRTKQTEVEEERINKGRSSEISSEPAAPETNDKVEPPKKRKRRTKAELESEVNVGEDHPEVLKPRKSRRLEELEKAKHHEGESKSADSREQLGNDQPEEDSDVEGPIASRTVRKRRNTTGQEDSKAPLIKISEPEEHEAGAVTKAPRGRGITSHKRSTSARGRPRGRPRSEGRSK